MKYPRPLCEKNHSALSAFCDLRVLAATVICLTGLTLAAFAVAPGKYSAGNTIIVGNINGADVVMNLHDGDLRTKPDRGGVALKAPGWIPTGSGSLFPHEFGWVNGKRAQGWDRGRGNPQQRHR